jgi:hypothetical protein
MRIINFDTGNAKRLNLLKPEKEAYMNAFGLLYS